MSGDRLVVLELRGRTRLRPHGRRRGADSPHRAGPGPVRGPDPRPGAAAPPRGARDAPGRCLARQRSRRDLNRRRLRPGARLRPGLLCRTRPEPGRKAPRVARLGPARHALGRGGPLARRARRGRDSRCGDPDHRGRGMLRVPARLVARRGPVVRRRPARLVEPPSLQGRRASLHAPGRARVREAALAARNDHLRVRRERSRRLHLADRRRVAARPARSGRLGLSARDSDSVDEHRLAQRRGIDSRIHRRRAGPEYVGRDGRPRVRRISGCSAYLEHALDR